MKPSSVNYKLENSVIPILLVALVIHNNTDKMANAHTLTLQHIYIHDTYDIMN